MDEETHYPLSCDDCGGFQCMRWDGERETWTCPTCDEEETDEEEE